MKKFICLFILTIFLGSTAVEQAIDQTLHSTDFISQKKQKISIDGGKNGDPRCSPQNRTNTPVRDNGQINDNHDKACLTLTFDSAWANRFQTVLDSLRLSTGLKGASLAVLVPEQGLFTAVTGISYPGVPITKSMRFGIASSTKLFTAVTMTKLQEQGILSLDDHLYQWLPAFPNIDPTTTIRQLLSHQSGICNWEDNTSLLSLMMSDTSHFWTPQEILAYVGPPYFAPGHGYGYSNTNYLLSGMIIEEATGSGWVQSLHNFIFDPLLMDSTFVGAFESRNGPIAAEWLSNSLVILHPPMTGECSLGNSSGAIFSTAQEMAEWYNALFSGIVVSENSLNEITDFEPTSLYGLGLEEGIFKNHLSYYHGGAMLGYRSEIWYDVQTRAVMCLLANDGSFKTPSFMPLLKVLIDDFPKKPNDAGISKIISPWEISCNTTVFPLVRLTNFGSSLLTSANIIYQIDGDPPVVYSWTGSLNSDDTVNVTLPQIEAGTGSHQFVCFTELPNGVPEGYTFNDTAKSNFIFATLPSVIGELSEGFDELIFPPAGWVVNSSLIYPWGKTTLAHFSGNGSAVRSNYNDSLKGVAHNLDMPIIHVAKGTHPFLSFEYAYAPYPNIFCDSLQVLISTDCGTNWKTLFSKGSNDLQTAPPTVSAFCPQSGAEWKQESFSLAADTGDILIRFRNVCGFGNNLYLDEVNVSFPTDILKNNPSEEFSIYPNPASDEINISGLPVNSEIRISDLTGKLLLSKTTRNSPARIDLQQLQQGVYIFKSALGMKKIVKM